MASGACLFFALSTIGSLALCATGGVVEVWGEGGGQAVVAGRNAGPLPVACRAALPGQAVSWTHDGLPLTPDSRRRLANATLIFKKVVHKKKWSLALGTGSEGGLSDAGLYRCVVSTPHGSLLSTPLHLFIAGLAHEFSESPGNETTGAGSLVRLRCSIDSIPAASIVWQKDGQSLPQIPRYFTSESGSLYISNLKREDAGKYRCLATNEATGKWRTSREGTLSIVPLIEAPPASGPFLEGAPPTSFLASPSSVMTAAPGPAAPGSLPPETPIPPLVCASPYPHASLTWIYTKPDGTNSTISTNKGLNILKVGSNSIYKNGSYFCILTQANKVTAIMGVNVTVGSSARIVSEVPANLKWPTGKTLQLPCGVSGGVPPPTIVWYKNAYRLVIDGKVKSRGGNLTVSTVEGSDSGFYQCEARQEGAGATGIWLSTVRLSVVPLGDQPPRPANVTCRPVSATSIAVSWSVPAYKDIIPGYTIHVTPSDGGEEDRDLVLNKTSFTKERLQPYTNYTFYVRSFAGRALSESSNKVVCCTAEAVPTGWPEVTVKALSRCCIMVSWTPPPISEARGAITHYRVQWKHPNQTYINFRLLPGYIRQYSITDVYVGEEYLVRVLGATALGWPENRDHVPWKNITVPRHYLSRLPPPFVTASIIDSTTINVEWYPSEEVEVKGYNLYFKKLPEEIVGAVILASNISQYTISNLKTNRWYEVGVSSYEAEGDGEPCPVALKLGVPAVLEAPRKLAATPRSPLSLTVAWAAANRAPRYALRFSDSTAINATPTTVITNDTSLVLSGLKSGVYYDIEVLALGSGDQQSEPSLPIQAQTLPQGNYQMEWKSTGNGTVEVWWRGGADSILNYVIYYTPDPSTPLHHWSRIVLPPTASTATLSDIKWRIKYTVQLRGVSGSGEITFLAGELEFTIPDPDSPTEHAHTNSDQILGMLVGSLIGLCFMAICSASVAYRRRCFKAHGQPASGQMEMEALTSPSVPPSTLLPAKGDLSNGPINGVRLPLIMNGKVPNGHLNDKNLRITENPQFEGGGRSEGDEGSNRTTDEGDSLLSGGEGVGGPSGGLVCHGDCCISTTVDCHDMCSGPMTDCHDLCRCTTPSDCGRLSDPWCRLPKVQCPEPDDGFVDSNHMLA